MTVEAARLDLLGTANPAAAGSTRRTAVLAGVMAVEQPPPATEAAALADPAADGTRVAAVVAPAGPEAFFAVAALARTATLLAAGTMAARAAAVELTGQTAQAAVDHPDPFGDRSQRILGVAAIGDRRREVGAPGVDVDRRNFAGDGAANDPGPNHRRRRGNRSDRDCRGQGQRCQSRYPSPYSETHGQSLFNVRCSLLECRNRRALVVTGRPARTTSHNPMAPSSKPPVSRNAGRRPWRITDRVGLVHSPFGSSAVKLECESRDGGPGGKAGRG